MFKGPVGFGKLLSIFMTIIICFTVSVYLMWRVQSTGGPPVFTFVSVLQSFILSSFVSYTCSELVPVFNWGMKLVGALHVKNRIGTHVIISVVLGTCFAIMILFMCSLINNMVANGLSGSWDFFIENFVKGVWGIIIGLVLVFLIPVQKLCAKISGFDPAAVPEP